MRLHNNVCTTAYIHTNKSTMFSLFKNIILNYIVQSLQLYLSPHIEIHNSCPMFAIYLQHQASFVRNQLTHSQYFSVFSLKLFQCYEYSSRFFSTHLSISITNFCQKIDFSIVYVPCLCKNVSINVKQDSYYFKFKLISSKHYLSTS